MLLGTRVVEHMLEVIPEPPKKEIQVNFVLDSQCTALSLNPSLSQKERRRHNVSIRTHRNLGNISAMNNSTLINLYWAPGPMNPADLSSKTHPNLAAVVNGSFYRHGHPSYSGVFPPEQAILFATMKGGVYKLGNTLLTATSVVLNLEERSAEYWFFTLSCWARTLQFPVLTHQLITMLS